MIDILKKIQSLEDTSEHIIFQEATTQSALGCTWQEWKPASEGLNNALTFREV